MASVNIDRETLDLIIQLQLEDLNGLRNTQGKNREGEATDTELALQAYEDELATRKQLLEDLSMSRSIARAVGLDANTIKAIVSEERQAAHDQQVATGISSGQQNEDLTTRAACDDSGLDEELLDKLAALYVSPPDDDDGDGDGDGDGDEGASPGQAESFAWAAARVARPLKPGKKLWTVVCDSCNERSSLEDMASCQCTHRYCRDCLENLVRSSLTDESLFPPRCCRRDITIDFGFLPADLVGEFRAKKLEFETENRTYCHQPLCSAFVPLEFIHSDIATCIKCQELTCVVCKGASHEGDCPHDTETQEMLQFATENGWKRCYSCRRVVELSVGCNHMTCLCRAEFCYECERQWKTCNCAHWEEGRLETRANAIVNRERPRAGQDRAHMVEIAMENLMENHECDHNIWRTVWGRNRCEECRDTLPTFIFECVQCRIMTCRRCRFHRI